MSKRTSGRRCSTSASAVFICTTTGSPGSARSRVWTWLDAERAAREYPALGGVTGALFTPVHGYVAAEQAASALAAAAESRGATFHRATVKRIGREGASLTVTTSSHRIDADAVVVA